MHWRDNSSNESGFDIYRGTSKTNLTKVGSVAKNITWFNQSPPAKNTTYYYTVRAYDSAGVSGAAATISGKVSTSSTTMQSTPSKTTTTTTTTSIKTTSTTTTSTSQPTGTVIHIGPNETVKTLNNAYWPSAGSKPVTFILDPSSTPYTLSPHFLYGNLTIEAANPNNRPTIALPPSYKEESASKYDAENPTIEVVGTLNVSDVNTSGGINTIFLGSEPGGNIDAQRVHMLQGGAMWLGSGGNDVTFKDNQILGKPRYYAYANFNNTLNNLVIDNSDTTVPVQQGGWIVDGQPIGEAAIRIMDVNNATLEDIITTPWFYKSGQEWKQDVQLRPSSKDIQVIGCHFYQPDVGDMTWRSPAMPIQEVDFIDDSFDKSPNITNGVSEIKFSDTLIGSHDLTETL